MKVLYRLIYLPVLVSNRPTLSKMALSTSKIISDQTKSLIDKPLLEKLPLAGIARVTDVSEVWYKFMWIRNMLKCRAVLKCGPKKGALGPRMWRGLVIRRQQRKQTVNLASHRPSKPRNYRYAHRRLQSR